MKKYLQNIKELLTFTRGERVGVVVLVVVLLAVFLYPHFVSNSKVEDTAEFEKFKAQVDEFEASKIVVESEKSDEKPRYSSRQKAEKTYETFAFDPNTADSKTLMRLGFSEKQANVIINYRNKGGRFRTPDDFKKMYVVSDETYARLQSYIKIENVEKLIEKPSATKIETETKTVETRERKSANINVEINAADTSELKKLRGIGSYYAKRIVDYREKLGGFTSTNQLLEIRGIDAERFAQFETQISVDISNVKKIKINEVDEKMLSTHPYINNYAARGIEQYCRLAGKIENLQQLEKEKILTKEQVEKLKPYIEF